MSITKHKQIISRATIKQERVAGLIIENALLDKPLNAGQILEKAGYNKNISKTPGKVINSRGVQEELEMAGFSEHAAMKVVDEIMNDKNVDPSARLKATDQVFKVRGTYAPEKSIVANIQVNEIKREKSNGLFDSILGN
jgi:hypothetical protein